MKLQRVLLLVLVCLCLTSLLSFAQSKVLIIVREASEDMNYAISQEVNPMIKMLTDAGYQAEIATETGTALGTGTSVLQPNTKLSEVDVDKYVGLIIPCAVNAAPFFCTELFHGNCKKDVCKRIANCRSAKRCRSICKGGSLGWQEICQCRSVCAQRQQGFQRGSARWTDNYFNQLSVLCKIFGRERRHGRIDDTVCRNAAEFQVTWGGNYGRNHTNNTY